MTILYFSVVKAVHILNTLVSVSLETGLIKPTILILQLDLKSSTEEPVLALDAVL